MSALDADLDVAIEAARAAARVHASGRDGDLQIRSKSTAIDLVTRVDTEAEAAVRAVLGAARPTDAILGEEGGASGAGARRWIVDPLDGTLNYAHGFPWYCVSIGLEIDGVVQVGVVLDSARGQLYTAVRGQGAHRDGVRLRTTPQAALAASMLATGFPYDEPGQRQNLRYFSALLGQTRAIRRPGAAALDLAMLAAGQLDGFWEFGLAPWDVAAGALLVHEAGGRVTDPAGADTWPDTRAVVASNGPLHGALLAALAAV